MAAGGMRKAADTCRGGIVIGQINGAIAGIHADIVNSRAGVVRIVGMHRAPERGEFDGTGQDAR